MNRTQLFQLLKENEAKILRKTAVQSGIEYEYERFGKIFTYVDIQPKPITNIRLKRLRSNLQEKITRTNWHIIGKESLNAIVEVGQTIIADMLILPEDILPADRLDRILFMLRSDAEKCTVYMAVTALQELVRKIDSKIGN